MSIKINRFEAKPMNNTIKRFEITNNTSILLKDHASDKHIGFIELCNNQKQNMELAKRIINVIEDYILEQKEDATKD